MPVALGFKFIYRAPLQYDLSGGTASGREYFAGYLDCARRDARILILMQFAHERVCSPIYNAMLRPARTMAAEIVT